MDERYERPVRACSGRLVDQPDATRLEPGERDGNVGHPERDVMEARAPFRNVFADRRIVGGRLEQLERGATGRYEMRSHTL